MPPPELRRAGAGGALGRPRRARQPPRSRPPETPARGGAELLAEGGRPRRLQGLTKPTARRAVTYTARVVMETHQLKPAAIGSGREASGEGRGLGDRQPGPGRRGRGARRAKRQRLRVPPAPRVLALPRPQPRAPPARAPPGLAPRLALRQTRARAPRRRPFRPGHGAGTRTRTTRRLVPCGRLGAQAPLN
ncbi:Hypothetical predicted protein [Marmota monax]|uniref:Uncharacterized protein n=1 Tax=Marmota monax TaxID=9995 RepID=A0A5E4BLT6_MARMO|nr:Hypothetical predicted protein [Marmota monax]